MGNRLLVFYGSYRSDRAGIRLAQFVVDRLRSRGDDVELIDAKVITCRCSIGCTRSTRAARPPNRLSNWQPRFATQMGLCLSQATTIGVFSPA